MFCPYHLKIVPNITGEKNAGLHKLKVKSRKFMELTTYKHGGRRTALTSTQQTIQIHHTRNNTCFHHTIRATYVVTLVCTRNSLRMVIYDNRNM